MCKETLISFTGNAEKAEGWLQNEVSLQKADSEWRLVCHTKVKKSLLYPAPFLPKDHIGFLAYEVRTTVVGIAKWKTLKLSPILHILLLN